MTRSKETVGVIVGRFQVDRLHNGHMSLIRYVGERHDKVLIMIGTTETRGTDTNPLDFATRRSLFMGVLGDRVHTFPQPDHISDVEWSKTLDIRITYATQGRPAVIYGSRDSFIPHYSGNYPVEIAPAVEAPSGTEIRENAAKSAVISPDFRAGVIYSTQRRYPISYQTVDVAIFDSMQPGIAPIKLLLGRKRGESLWRFPGGFVDPTDESLESAAAREAKEETSLDVLNTRYLGSYRIDDWRYKRDKDKILTAFFMAKGIVGQEKASDDLEEVRWFDGIPVSEIVPNHRVLARRLVSVTNEIYITGGI